MSEMILPAPTETPAPVPVPVAPVQVPAGYVPQSDLDRKEEQRRGFQSENERLKAELTRLQVAPPAAPVTDSTDISAQLAAMRNEFLNTASSVLAIQASVPVLRTEFPYADPSLFSTERLKGFGSPEALRVAVEADHNRIETAREAVRQELQGPTPAPAPSPLGPAALPAAGVDPTIQQLAAMSPTDLASFEAANPGVIGRVMGAAQAQESVSLAV